LREGLFIRKNKEIWEQIEHGSAQTADETAANFKRLINDLGYAKTFYPTSRITAYLNALASSIYLNIYQNRKENSNRIALFFRYGVPITIYRHRRILLMALGVFIIFFSVGFFSSQHDPGFVRQVLGDKYVSETEENIRKGNPFDIYAQTNSFVMWIYIMLNNIIVSVTYFFRGLLLGIPSITALGKESVRLGAFEYMFFEKGLGRNAVVTVLLHGMLELSAIIMACGAGVIMGTSFLFPGTRSRLHAFREGVKDGVKIIVVLVPVFMVAAFIEGYITRYYKMPLVLSLALLAITTSFIVGYFAIYPYWLNKRSRKMAATAE
jgi:uncharacterized membrane protein SpoIIM required for sporulation